MPTAGMRQAISSAFAAVRWSMYASSYCFSTHRCIYFSGHFICLHILCSHHCKIRTNKNPTVPINKIKRRYTKLRSLCGTALLYALIITALLVDLPRCYYSFRLALFTEILLLSYYLFTQNPTRPNVSGPNKILRPSQCFTARMRVDHTFMLLSASKIEQMHKAADLFTVYILKKS